MNPQNYPNSAYMDDREFIPNPTYQNYTPYLKQPLPPKPIDKRTIALSLHDLLKQNIGRVINVSSLNNTYKGVLEYVSDSYLILHDPKSHNHTILFLKDLNSIIFEDDIQFLAK